MFVKKIAVSVFAFLLSTSLYAESSDSGQGSFHGKVTDGSELVAYNKFLDSLKNSRAWIALGAVREGGELDTFKGYKGASVVYMAMVSEAGAKEIPKYDSDTLDLVNIAGFRKYAEAAKSNSSFVSTSETCGAALTFAYSAVMTGLLVHYRPVMTLQKTLMQNELLPIGEKINKETAIDYQSIVVMCKGQGGDGLVASLENVFNNLNSDISNVLPLVDKEYDYSEYPFIATLSCGMGDGNINVRACFKKTDLKISTPSGVKLYKIYNMDQAGTIDRQGLTVKLPEHFSLVGQNDHDILILSLVVKDRAGKVLYTDSQGQYGVVNISH